MKKKIKMLINDIKLNNKNKLKSKYETHIYK